uniref:Transmembrane protein n=1 Tax=Mesocestoides corti TaxID=53468 RepID=A0A5K3FY39_MESCO
MSPLSQYGVRARRQVPSIRVYHVGHAAQYILPLIRVLLWLAAYLPRMLLERRDTQDWLRPGWSNISNASAATHIENPSPNMKNTGTTEEALLTNWKPGPRVRRLPSEPATLATPFIIYCTSVVFFSGWRLIFLAFH